MDKHALDTLFERADAIASATDNSDVGSIIATCPNVALNFGVFFDGTYNNAANVAAFNSGATTEIGGSYDNYITNIARLSEQYFQPADDTQNSCGRTDQAYRSRYIPGIGTTTGEADEGFAAATGLGQSGLEEKLEEAAEALEDEIRRLGGPSAIRAIKIDIFGFSRGAATARVFANLIAQGDLANAEVRFLGIYDTVGSFGIPGDDSEYGIGGDFANALCEVNLGISPICLLVPSEEVADLDIRAKTAAHVFHIVADDEFRAFFPSSSIKPGHGVEVVMPGNHGDIGGATPPAQYVEDTLNPPRFLRERGYWDTAYRQDIPPSNNVDRLMRNWDYNYRRMIEPGLWTAGYTAMLARARQAGVPLRDSPVAVPPDLQPMVDMMIAGQSLPEEARRPIRTKYVRMSHDGLGPNMLDIDHARESYPNKP